MNPKLLKMVAKFGLGLVGSAVIGTLIKLERQAGDRIDNYFDDSKTTEDAQPE